MHARTLIRDAISWTDRLGSCYNCSTTVVVDMKTPYMCARLEFVSYIVLLRDRNRTRPSKLLPRHEKLDPENTCPISQRKNAPSQHYVSRANTARLKSLLAPGRYSTRGSSRRMSTSVSSDMSGLTEGGTWLVDCVSNTDARERAQLGWAAHYPQSATRASPLRYAGAPRFLESSIVMTHICL